MIPLYKPYFNKEELKLVARCIKTGWVSSAGKNILIFEDKFKKYIGTKYASATSSGTSALHLALLALGIGKGDEVILPALTHIATANAVIYTSAKPIFIDSEPFTYNIDPTKIEEKITKRTKAIIVVHLYGHPANLEPILKLAKKYNFYVIEDGAQALGAEYLMTMQNAKCKMQNWKKVGSSGNIGVFSFNGNKIITTGSGGMVVTNNKKLAKKMKLLAREGKISGRKYLYSIVGYNYRMNNISASLGISQLRKINKIIEKKREIAKFYNLFLKNIDGISLPPQTPSAKSTFWLYCLSIDKKFPISRNQLIEKLASVGIESRPFWTPVHLQRPYSKKDTEKFPVAEKLAARGICLPSSPSLIKKEIKKVVNIIKETAD